jgi:hypothetical protein
MPVIIQSMSWSGPATNPSRLMVKCQSTLPSAVCGAMSFIVVSSTG